MQSDRCKVVINDEPEKGYTVAFISGALNLFTARQVRAELEPLLKSECLRAIVDIEDLQTIDSSGIGALVNFVLAARKHDDARVVFTQPRPIVMHIFEVTKLKSFFTIVADHEMARVYFED
ncbi:MAG: STAS domain-containing protein [Spirochaetes bacterium]|nr:STAS domain-containing protein [Spirochaetota bacterium]